MTTDVYLENALAPALALEGPWTFRLGSNPEWTIPVPAAWEAHTRDKVTDGPAIYRREFTLPDEWLGCSIFLEAQAISFDATVRVNGQAAGHHRGMWSPFQIEITPFMRPGQNEIEIEVWKPGQRFAVREALAGFLPDVCTAFGGIWQRLGLRAFARAAFSDVRIQAQSEGRVDVEGALLTLSGEPGPRQVQVDVLDDDERLVTTHAAPIHEAAFSLSLPVPAARPWPGTRYTVRLSLTEGEMVVAQLTRRVGFRAVRAEGQQTTVNGRPVHFRGALDWGWNPERIAPVFTREELLDNFAKARSLGFNLIKACLFVPDETFLDAADESGLWLWLEMPLWLPRLGAEARALILQEYAAVFRRLHHHPSIALLSLGCEMNSEADAQFLKGLAGLARTFFPNSLHCDNSGSAEAYGGVLTRLSDFYDYHFYTDPHFFAALVDHFDRPYRPPKPWIYGEFCDADTLRDFSKLKSLPWWLTEKVALERDDYLYMRDHPARLQAAAIADGGAALTSVARQQATAVRKFILETVRARHATGGYVITGWTDTPITTSGVVDDERQLKFDPAVWQSFNADRVLLIDRERRRKWRGGDRPARRDPFSWWQGERAEIHVLLSNGGEAIGPGPLNWSLLNSAGETVAAGQVAVDGVAAGEVSEIAVLGIEMPGPNLAKPMELALQVDLGVIHNAWPVWVVPRVSPGPPPNVMESLTEAALNHVRAGGSALLWQTRPDSGFTRAVPFWREAIHVFEPHPLWERVPHAGYADMRFFSVATDLAFDRAALQSSLGADVTPIWRRFDARQMTWAEYLVEVRLGAGRLFLTTLRFAGGLGYQPDTLDTNPWGSWLLAEIAGMPAK